MSTKEARISNMVTNIIALALVAFAVIMLLTSCVPDVTTGPIGGDPWLRHPKDPATTTTRPLFNPDDPINTFGFYPTTTTAAPTSPDMLGIRTSGTTTTTVYYPPPAPFLPNYLTWVTKLDSDGVVRSRCEDGKQRQFPNIDQAHCVGLAPE